MDTVHSEKFIMVRNFYVRRAWTINKVRDAVVKGWITQDEFLGITGEEY